MKRTIFTIGLMVTSLFAIQSCKKDKAEADADDTLYKEMTAGGYAYYQSGAILSGVSPSPHGSFKLRFNATAFAALDSTGELPAGNTFPSGSIIVKEIFDGSSINLYAIMKKDPSNENAGSGWLWAEYKPDGSTAFSAKRKGDGCISCHSGSPQRDLVRTFDLH
jgi:Cytochrome P460